MERNKTGSHSNAGLRQSGKTSGNSIFPGFLHTATDKAASVTKKYGTYTLAATVFAASSLYLGALFLAPTLIPFGLAAIATTWIKYTVAAAMLAAVVSSGAFFLTRTYNEFQKLVNRYYEGRLTNYDVALLGTAAVAGFSVVGMMYAFPTMLPLLGTLGTYTKAATAAVIGTASSVSTAAVASATFFAARPAPESSDLEEDESTLVNLKTSS